MVIEAEEPREVQLLKQQQAEAAEAEAIMNKRAVGPLSISADIVALEMDKLVAEGRITPADKSLVVWFFTDARSKKESLAQAAQHIRYDATTLSRLFRGQYEGNLAKVLKAIKGYRQLCGERERLSRAEFVETSIWEQIRQTCDFALLRRRPVRIVGVSQIGKTAALLEYQRRSDFLVRYARIPSAPTFRNIVETIAEACGISTETHAKLSVLRARILKSLDANSLLIVDELHELAITASRQVALNAVEWFREIYDQRRCGLVLCGTRSMEDDLFSGACKGWLDQLDQRCVRVTNLPLRLSEEDITLTAKAYGLPEPGPEVLDGLKLLRMGRLTLALQLATDVAARRGVDPSWPLFASALSTIRGV